MKIRIVKPDAQEVGALCTMRDGEKIRFPYFSQEDTVEINLDDFSEFCFNNRFCGSDGDFCAQDFPAPLEAFILSKLR